MKVFSDQNQTAAGVANKVIAASDNHLFAQKPRVDPMYSTATIEMQSIPPKAVFPAQL